MERENLSSIVIKAKTGDNAALNNLFTETYNDVYYFALKTVKDETLASDVTQETFVTIFQNLDKLNDPLAYPAWSRQITYRHCLQYIKKQNREVVVEENEDGSTIFDTIEEDKTEFIPQENLDKEDFKKTIMDIVDALPDEQRTTVLLYYFDELSVKQIAEIQDVSEGTIKSRLNYARKTIKAAVEDYENKHNIKLHSVGVFPLLLWSFASDFGASALSATTATTIATGVSSATGATLSVSRIAQITSKLFGALWQKVVAGVVGAGIVAGSVTAVVVANNKPIGIDIGPIEQYEEVQSEEGKLVAEKPTKRPASTARISGFLFANAYHLPYFSNVDELSAEDAFWFTYLYMYSSAKVTNYAESKQKELGNQIIPIEVIYSYMKSFFGKTYDCSNLKGIKHHAFIGDYIPFGFKGKPAMRIVFDEEYHYPYYTNFEFLQEKIVDGKFIVTICWHFNSHFKPDDTVTDWVYDEANERYKYEKYGEVVLKQRGEATSQLSEKDCEIVSYLPMQKP